MNVKILTLVIVLLVSLLCSASAGPMASMKHGRELEEASTVRKMVQQSAGGQTHRSAGWKKRRQRPHLSQKGPMPF
ncbi:apelin [Echeneis naucrates]|uniref:apelin n=1 Tax=Echeneis naucrates TaxID=173247 RepID=UPI0011140395|nr:apelin [Echeneis naucrates]